MDNYIKNIGAAGEAASETPQPSTNRELFPRSVAPTIPLNLTPIQRRAAHGRGTMTTESGMAAASAAAATAAEAASLLEKAFEEADKEEQARHSAPADSAADQQLPVETTQPPKRTTINPNNTHNTPTLQHSKQSEYSPPTPDPNTAKSNQPSLSNNTPTHQHANTKPSQLTVKRQPIYSPPPDLSFLRRQGSALCEMRTALETAASKYQLEENLICEKKAIHGLHDLHAHCTSTYTDLAQKITDTSTGNLLRRELSDYFFAFQGRKKTSLDTAAAITLIQASNARTDLDLIVRQSIVAGAGLTPEGLTRLAGKAAQTGSLGDHISTADSLDHFHEGQWLGLLRVAIEATCYDANKHFSFESQKTIWYTLDISKCPTHTTAIALESFHYEACEGIFGGPFCSEYDRFSNFKSAMERHQPHIAGDLHDLIIDGLETDTLDITWSAAKDLFRKAFARNSRRSIKNSIKRPDLNPTDADIPSTHQLSIHSAGLTTNDSSNGNNGRSLNLRDYEDMMILCVRNLTNGSVCGKEFKHSAADQLRYAELGFPNHPKGCPECRKRLRELDTTGRSRPCIDFTRTGACKNGDKCIRSHSESPESNKEIVPYTAHFGTVDCDSDGSDDIDPDCY